MLVGQVRNDRVVVFCGVRGYGGRRVWRPTVSPTRESVPVSTHACLASLVLARLLVVCLWSVYGHAVAALVVLLVHGCLSRPTVGLFGIGSLALQQALARSDVVVVMPVSVLVGNIPVALGRQGTFWLCAASPSWGRKVATVGMTAEKSFRIWYDMPCPALGAALHAHPVIWYFAVPFGRPFSSACAIHMYTPVGGKAPWVPLGASPCRRPRVLLRLSGAVLVFMSACLSCAVSCRVLRVMWLACQCRSVVSRG